MIYQCIKVESNGDNYNLTFSGKSDNNKFDFGNNTTVENFVQKDNAGEYGAVDIKYYGLPNEQATEAAGYVAYGKSYANYRNNYALGFGSELFYGFHLYLEPSIQYINYKGTRWTVKDYSFKQIKERDIITKYSISLSNRNLSLWDFVPTLTYSYIDKSSNIWQREYQKSMIELSVKKRF